VYFLSQPELTVSLINETKRQWRRKYDQRSAVGKPCKYRKSKNRAWMKTEIIVSYSP
jgi:hypothetical protein